MSLKSIAIAVSMTLILGGCGDSSQSDSLLSTSERL
jgi:hypothetical protein